MQMLKLKPDNFVRFCQQDEENDPSEEFELYLACGVCGDNGLFWSIIYDEADKAVAHRQCARGAGALKSEDGK